MLPIYSAIAESIPSAIQTILEQWSRDFLAFLNAIPRKDLYKKIRVANRSVNWLCWTIGEAFPNTDPQLAFNAEKILESHQPPISIKFMPGEIMLAFIDHTCRPRIYPSSISVSKPTIMLLL
jgi:hypothetical protein